MDSSTGHGKPNQLLRLLTPSPIGIVMCSFLAVLFIVLNQFRFIEHYLQIPSSFQVMHMVFGFLDRVLTAVLGTTRTAAFVVGLFWAVVGLGVYIFLRGVAHFIIDLGEGYEARGFVWPKGADRNIAVHQAAERIVFRIVAFIGLLIVLFVPLAAVINGPVFTGFAGPNLMVRLVVWFVAGWLTLHLTVIMLRLVVLKPRLFS